MLKIQITLATVTLLFLPSTDCSRSRANAKDIPACYYDNIAESAPYFDSSNGYTQCSNPLYKRCSYWVCCSPDHYCCTIDGYTNGACCRKESMNAYEITGIVTGVIAWVGNIIVILTCITPQISRVVKRRFFKKRNTVVPGDLDSTMEMKHHGKNF